MNFFEEIDNFNEDLITLFPGVGSSSSSLPCNTQPWLCDPSWVPPALVGNIQTVYSELVLERIFVFQCNTIHYIYCGQPIDIVFLHKYKPMISLPPLPNSFGKVETKINNTTPTQELVFVRDPHNPPYWVSSMPSYPIAAFPTKIYLNTVNLGGPTRRKYSFYSSVGEGGATQNCDIYIEIAANQCCPQEEQLKLLCNKKNQLITFNQSQNYTI